MAAFIENLDCERIRVCWFVAFTDSSHLGDAGGVFSSSLPSSLNVSQERIHATPSQHSPPMYSCESHHTLINVHSAIRSTELARSHSKCLVLVLPSSRPHSRILPLPPRFRRVHFFTPQNTPNECNLKRSGTVRLIRSPFTGYKTHS